MPHNSMNIELHLMDDSFTQTVSYCWTFNLIILLDLVLNYCRRAQWLMLVPAISSLFPPSASSAWRSEKIPESP